MVPLLLPPDEHLLGDIFIIFYPMRPLVFFIEALVSICTRYIIITIDVLCCEIFFITLYTKYNYIEIIINSLKKALRAMNILSQ